MSRDPWFESDDPSVVARGFGWRAAVWVVVAVVFFGALSAALWAFGVFSSDVKGQGDATKEKNSGVNRVTAQAQYVELYNDVKAADQRVQVMSDALSSVPSQVNQTNYVGAVSFCQQAVADYNKLADQYLSADYLPDGYPAQIDGQDPATDCKEEGA